MSRNQRQHHAHLRRMDAIKRRAWSSPKTRRVPVLMGHTHIKKSYGDGYTEPREHYESCSCGAPLLEAMQPYEAYVYQTWRQHLIQAKRTRKPLLHKGRKL